MQADFIAKALGGRRAGAGWTARCPAHADSTPSLSISVSSNAKVLVHCHAGCDQAQVIGALKFRGLWRDQSSRSFTRDYLRKPVKDPVRYGADRTLVAKALWTKSIPAKGTPVETYLRTSRGYQGLIPATLRFLPASEKHPPAMIAAFAMAAEIEPGLLCVSPDAVRAVHLTKLKPDGMGKADIPDPKIILGRGAVGVPIVVAPPNDLLGLAITEGIEDALSVHAAMGFGAWAAGSASRMPALADSVPVYIDCVTIYGDDNKAGIEGATALLRRLNDRGIFAQIKFFNPSIGASNG
jgi:hypothetical protein